MTVITISRQLGSLGSQIAKDTAELLGYRLVWRDLINEAALRAGAPELALAVIDDLGLLGISLSKKDLLSYRKALKQVMKELYAAGEVVVVGRGGQIVLRGKPGVMHVRVIAPAELRAQRLAARHNIPIDKAIAQVDASDKNRRKLLKRLYRIKWDDPDLYDLVINTAHLSVADSASLIVQAVSQLERALPGS